MSNTPTPPWRVLRANGDQGAACTDGTSAVLKRTAIWTNDAIPILVTMLLLLSR
jgi:hypothetical protein